MTLAVSLTHKEVKAACRLHDEYLPHWRTSEAALLRLNELMPPFAPDVCLLKSVAVNAIYGTQVLAIVRVANYVAEIMSNTDAYYRGPELAEKISDLPSRDGEKPRKRTSFASKFCHFFVEAEQFPIYDDAAGEAIKLHLGRDQISNKTHPYLAFCENFSRIRTEADLHCTTRELDRYLWLTGLYMRWLKERSKKTQRINAEVKRLFTNPTRAAAGELDTMLPNMLERAFEGIR